MTPRIDVVIVTHRSRQEIEACLDSVLAVVPPSAVTVVDNASEDGTVDWIRGRHPAIDVIEA